MSKKDDCKPIFKHVLKDGTVLDTLEGFVIYYEKNKEFYESFTPRELEILSRITRQI